MTRRRAPVSDPASPGSKSSPFSPSWITSATAGTRGATTALPIPMYSNSFMADPCGLELGNTAMSIAITYEGTWLCVTGPGIQKRSARLYSLRSDSIFGRSTPSPTSSQRACGHSGWSTRAASTSASTL